MAQTKMLDLKEYRDFYQKYLKTVLTLVDMEEEFNRKKKELGRESDRMHKTYMSVYHVLEYIEVGDMELNEAHFLEFFKKIKHYQARRRYVKNLSQKYSCLQKIVKNNKNVQGNAQRQAIVEGLNSLLATHAKVAQDTVAGAKQLMEEFGIELNIKPEIRVPTYNRKIRSCKTEGTVLYADK